MTSSNGSTRSPSSSPTSGGIFEEGDLERELSEIDHQMQEAGFWDTPAKNATVLQKRRDIERRLQPPPPRRPRAVALATWRSVRDEGKPAPEFARFIDRLETELRTLE